MQAARPERSSTAGAPPAPAVPSPRPLGVTFPGAVSEVRGAGATLVIPALPVRAPIVATGAVNGFHDDPRRHPHRWLVQRDRQHWWHHDFSPYPRGRASQALACWPGISTGRRKPAPCTTSASSWSATRSRSSAPTGRRLTGVSASRPSPSPKPHSGAFLQQWAAQARPRHLWRAIRRGHAALPRQCRRLDHIGALTDPGNEAGTNRALARDEGNVCARWVIFRAASGHFGLGFAHADPTAGGVGATSRAGGSHKPGPCRFCRRPGRCCFQTRPGAGGLPGHAPLGARRQHSAHLERYGPRRARFRLYSQLRQRLRPEEWLPNGNPAPRFFAQGRGLRWRHLRHTGGRRGRDRPLLHRHQY